MDGELLEILQAYKAALDYLINKVDQMDKMYEDNRAQVDERIHSLESTLFDEIVNPAKAYIDETNKNARFEDFNSKYGEKLGSFNDSLKAFEGEDFDLSKAAFDKYDGLPEEERPDEDEYVNAVIDEVSAQIDAIRKGLGLSDDAEVSVTQDEDGNTVVEADGEVVASDTNNDVQVPGEEEAVEDEEKSVDGEEPTEDSPEDIAAFEEELKNYKG